MAWASPRLGQPRRLSPDEQSSLHMRKLRRDDLPALRLFLANERHADLPRFWTTGGVDDAHEDAGITEDSNRCFPRSCAGEPARPHVLRDNVLFAQHRAVETAADEIIGNDATQRRCIAFAVRREI